MMSSNSLKCSCLTLSLQVSKSRNRMLYRECCVTLYCEKVLKSVQTWLPGFSAMGHYTTFAIASKCTHLGACVYNLSNFN